MFSWQLGELTLNPWFHPHKNLAFHWKQVDRLKAAETVYSTYAAGFNSKPVDIIEGGRLVAFLLQRDVGLS